MAVIKTHCVRCHGAPAANSKPAGEFRLDTLPSDPTADPSRWSAVRDQLRDGLMPPPDEPRPKPSEVRALVSWITGRLGADAPRLPNQGNLVPHELLFGPTADTAAEPATPARVWRLSPDAYMGWLREVYRGRAEQAGVVQPFTLVSERGIRDFAGLYSIDAPATEILLRNAAAVVEAQTAHTLKDGKVTGKNDTVREFVPLMDPTATPSRKQIESAVQTQYRLAIGRAASTDELSRFLALYDKCAAGGDRVGAIKTVLQAVLLKTDALYRAELGAGSPDGHGRRMLAPAELARALSLALGSRRDNGLTQAAEKGQLATREQIAAALRRVFDDPKSEANARMLQFFREYFEYPNADDVFKDRPKTHMHEPRVLIGDTDKLVAHILAADRDVFRELLTTPLSFANITYREDKKTRKKDVPTPASKLNPVNNRGQAGVESVYGLSDWPEQQPVRLPENTRIGILMQPAWLVAWSTNFENDPVRRGRWVRERLLGGTVPDLPIGVVAQVPDEPHRTYRDRLTVTRAAQCWKCHRHMDELGLPFEQFDHYGRFRTTETVLDREATDAALAAHQGKKGKAPEPVMRDAPLVTTGVIADSGDAKLDGPVADPREFVRKLANSDRCRQVFVRHVFRFFLGRNETLSDARTLQAADRAYVESGGSFRALVISLLTSDSFLYRLPSDSPSTAKTSANANASTTGAKR